MLRTVSLRSSRLSVFPKRSAWIGLSRSSSPVLLPSRAMSAHLGESSVRPEPDKVLQQIADYVHDYEITSDLAYETARLCLIDTIGCGLEGLRFPECASLLGPVVEGTIVPNGIDVIIFLVTLVHLQARNKSSGNKLPARSHTWSIQYWNHHSLA
jgi:MmgE/PrpD N-terminal domain